MDILYKVLFFLLIKYVKSCTMQMEELAGSIRLSCSSTDDISGTRVWVKGRTARLCCTAISARMYEVFAYHVLRRV